MSAFSSSPPRLVCTSRTANAPVASLVFDSFALRVGRFGPLCVVVGVPRSNFASFAFVQLLARSNLLHRCRCMSASERQRLFAEHQQSPLHESTIAPESAPDKLDLTRRNSSTSRFRVSHLFIVSNLHFIESLLDSIGFLLMAECVLEVCF